MKKIEYLLKALNGGAYTKKHWLITMFSQVGNETRKDSPYPWMVSFNSNGLEFYNPDSQAWEKIDDYKPNAPLFGVKDPISLKAGDLANVIEPVDTIIGSCIFKSINYYFMIFSFFASWQDFKCMYTIGK